MFIRVLLADDHNVLRAGLRTLLDREADIEVVAEAADGQKALGLAIDLKPDVALLDLNMPPPDGLEVVRQLAQMMPDIKCVILTAYEDATLLRECVQAGVSGYVVKSAVKSELINAIRAVYQGGLYIHPLVASALVRPVQPMVGDNAIIDALTPRETEVLGYIATGHTNTQIADVLCLSVRTVESHRANLMGKIGAQDRVDLVRYARERELSKAKVFG